MPQDSSTVASHPQGLAIGLMSGTSLDGIDAAIIETDGDEISAFGPSLTFPYDSAFRERLRGLLGRDPDAEPSAAAVIDELTRLHGEAVAAVLSEGGFDAGDIGAIGFHGHTVLHDPAHGVTRQIGDSALLAQLTGIRVVGDLRQADVSAGGEGAPMAPVYHVALSRKLERPVCILNVGGVANLTWISPDGGAVAFDTGPGNALMNDRIKAETGADLDKDGRLARSGSVDGGALAALLDNPYFSQPYPKSLDRDDFTMDAVAQLSLEDALATLAEFSAAAVSKGAELLPAQPLRWLVTGGGRHNPVLMAALRRCLNAPVEPVEGVGWRGDALEAQAFAFLAMRSLRGLPLSYPQTTGVRQPMPGGVVYAP